RNNPKLLSTGKAWAGKIQGVRLAMVPHPSALVRLDSLRIYQATAAARMVWSSPNTAPARLWWTDLGGALSTGNPLHAGVVGGSAASANNANAVATNVAGYPPNTQFWSVSASGARSFVGRTAPTPTPIIESPSVAGCANYLGRPWTFTSIRSLAGYGDLSSLSFTPAGRLAAVNAGPRPNDPYIYLPIGRGGIDGRVFHRLTIVESYNGPFDLHNAPGGGTMGRILWQSAGHTILAQTNDILTYSGKRTITLDMATPASVLTEPDGSPAQRYPFASTARVLKLRWDPNEDPGARHWQVYSIRLAADCGTRTTFALTWHDATFVAGSTVRIEARPSNGARPIQLGRATERAGTNTFTVAARSLPAGTYLLRVYTTNPAGVIAGGTATGPLNIAH
ncbi:MAG: hypothetical protein JWO57_2397, partial [Pseudonocardiales bacterium]|nr:hypothetical protein [Pseudonocardiales bacterium]